MATPLPIQNLTMDKILSGAQGGFARSNQYQVSITGGWGNDASGTPFIKHLSFYGLTWNTTLQEKLSFACSNVNLPSSTYATGEVKDNYVGVGQEFAHTRVNTDIDFSFYLDRDYEILTFFEAWIDYISGASNTPNSEDVGYYRRFAYPKYYKSFGGFFITKFEKNWHTPGAKNMTYQLINAFPKSLSSIPLQYGDAEVIRVSVTINYDRYRIFRNTSTAQIESPGSTGSNANSGKDPTVPVVPGTNTDGILDKNNIPQGNFKSGQ